MIREPRHTCVITVHGDALNEWVLGKLLEFCREAEKEVDQPAVKNMAASNWEEHPETLLNKLHSGTFDTGRGQLVTIWDKENEDIVAVSGTYRSEFDHETWIAGVRTWTRKQSRHELLVGRILLPAQEAFIVKNKGKAMCMTFNQANSSIPDLIIRCNVLLAEGKIHFPFFGTDYPSAYHEFILHPGHVRIQNVMQIVLWKALSPGYVPLFPSMTVK